MNPGDLFRGGRGKDSVTQMDGGTFHGPHATVSPRWPTSQRSRAASRAGCHRCAEEAADE